MHSEDLKAFGLPLSRESVETHCYYFLVADVFHSLLSKSVLQLR